MSTARMTRCVSCYEAGSAWCPHRGVLKVFIDHEPVYVRGRSEAAARLAADRLCIAWKGRPFHRKRESSECVA